LIAFAATIPPIVPPIAKLPKSFTGRASPPSASARSGTPGSPEFSGIPEPPALERGSLGDFNGKFSPEFFVSSVGSMRKQVNQGGLQPRNSSLTSIANQVI
jgi:hypothetical protein